MLSFVKKKKGWEITLLAKRLSYIYHHDCFICLALLKEFIRFDESVHFTEHARHHYQVLGGGYPWTRAEQFA